MTTGLGGCSFGLDVGTSGVKGIAVDEQGTVRGIAQRGYPLLTPRPGWAEQDPEEWWRASEAVLEELRAAAGTPRGIGLSGQMHGLVALGGNDRPLRPAMLWNDQRTAAEVDEIEQLIGLQRLISLSGNRALTGFTAPKVLWLRRHEPETYSRIASIMLPKDYVRLRLCGEHATDVADASGTLLFDVGARGWSEPIADALEVPGEWLPRALESAAISGHTGAGIPVAAGAGDQAAGALGVGVDRPGPASVVLGTSGVVFVALDGFTPDPQARTHTFCHAVPGAWHAMGVMLSAAGSLDWLRRVISPEDDFGALVSAAERWPAGVEGLVFLPYLVGERTPHNDPAATGAFAGLNLRHDRGALVRAVLEGVAFALRDCLDVLHAAGAHPTSAVVSGGGARSKLWLRILASALELPLARASVDEGAAFGAALLGGVAGGLWSDPSEAVEATVKVGGTVDPEPDWIRKYADAREHFRNLYPALRETGFRRAPNEEEH